MPVSYTHLYLIQNSIFAIQQRVFRKDIFTGKICAFTGQSSDKSIFGFIAINHVFKIPRLYSSFSLASVSYTHLDVYKRQKFTLLSNCGRRYISLMKVLLPYKFKLLSNYARAVSYTHLDVYKRQAPACPHSIYTI